MSGSGHGSRFLDIPDYLDQKLNLIKEEITKLSVPIGPFVYPIKSSVLPEEGARETNQKKRK